MRALVAFCLLASLCVTPAVASAAWVEPIAKPAIAAVDQAGWNAQKRRVKLSSGLELAYVDLGDPKGRPLLLLHGFTDSSRSWSLLVPDLHRYRLIIPDQRGHGASDAPDCCYDLTQLADDARQLLDALQIDRAAVAGHSMGSMVTMALAADHPERVERIVLLGSTAMAPVKRGDWLWTSVQGLTWPLDPDSAFLREWHPANQPTAVDPAFADAAMKDILSVKPHVWRGVVRALAEQPVARHASDVRAPVLILSGGKDPLFPAEHHLALVKAFPGSSAHVYPGLGHNFLWEHPAEVAQAIAAFMGE
jgi:pimeloyl-ACP methyl ester carboxylesterase